MTKTNSRREAAFILARWILTRDFPASLLPQGPNRAFVQDLVYTVLRRYRALRRILGELVTKWPKGELESLLYVGAAQILYMPDVPDFAAVNETVEAAKCCGNPAIARVVNGVLRNLLRRREELEAIIASGPLAERESFPTELVRRWIDRFGEQNAERLCQWHNTPAETFLARPDGTFTKLERGVRVESVTGFAEGEFLVQDPATALAVSFIDPKPGEQILDACAAPGGKTAQIAWRGANVTACEVNGKRRARLIENLKRLHLDVPVMEALPSANSPTTFDKILVDAPCSNSGVLRRRPDARWNWNLEKLTALLKLQSDILERCAPLVRAGGVLVYSTCSNEIEENSEQVAAFLKNHPEFALEKEQEDVPFSANHDGAFAARLVRQG